MIESISPIHSKRKISSRVAMPETLGISIKADAWEYGFRCVSASAVSLPASAVSERDDDRTEMEIVEFALI